MNQLDQVLREMSKKQDLGEITKMITDNIPSEFDSMFDSMGDKYLATVLTMQLRALTDKGFKARVAMLVQENLWQEDLDGDGEIYGIDWVFDNPPPALKFVTPNENAKIVEFTSLNSDK